MNTVTEKGMYNHRQPFGGMSVKQYIITRNENGKRCLLLRFYNESQLMVSDMEFLVTELNSSGEEIGSSVVRSRDIRVAPGSTFAHKKGIAIKEGCTDFKVTVISIMSHGYKYVMRHGQLVAHFDKRGFKEAERLSGGRQVCKRRGTSGATLVTWLAALLIIGCVGLAVYLSVRSFGKLETVERDIVYTETV